MNCKSLDYKYLVRIVVLAGAFVGPSLAGDDVKSYDPITALDSDGGKTIDISEMGKAASDTFDNLDSDGDGKIDLKAIGKRVTIEQFKQADADKDQMLDKNEYFAIADGLLRAADQDKDGALNENEFSSKEGKKLQKLIQ